MSSRILVIDDNEAILELFRGILELVEGYKVTLSKTAFEEIEDVEQLYPDLIILDLRLGSCKVGWDFLQKLETHSSTKDIPVILCTAATTEVGKHEGELRQKGITIVYKPFDLEELLQAVGRFLPVPPTTSQGTCCQ
jgi:CheY-like chemotaxis protein